MSAPELELAATVTRGAVRCSAWLGHVRIGDGVLILFLLIGCCFMVRWFWKFVGAMTDGLWTRAGFDVDSVHDPAMRSVRNDGGSHKKRAEKHGVSEERGGNADVERENAEETKGVECFVAGLADKSLLGDLAAGHKHPSVGDHREGEEVK